MRTNITQALSGHPHIDGVVLSSALAWPQGTIDPDQHADERGGHALRVHARVWRDLYAAEPDWPDTALRRFGLPPLTQVFAPTF
jgi:CHAD domain-containing protein